MGSVAANVAAIVEKARTSWLKNNEVLDLLEGYVAAGLSVCQEPPVRPEGGQLFLYDRRICRFFRRDGHNWRKKPDGKTIRETHEKLKVGNSEMLNCYYAHADQDDGLQRRCYWQLDPDKEHTVLVHYLCSSSSRAGGRGGAASAEAAEARPRRESARARRAYSPAATTGRRGSQTKLSPLATQGSMGSGSLVSQSSDAVSDAALPGDFAVLPLVEGMTLQTAAQLPSLSQQYAMQQQMLAGQLASSGSVQQRVAAAAAGAASAAADALAAVSSLPRTGSGNLAEVNVLDPFDLFAAADAELQRPHPGVLYTGQRMATQLATQQMGVNMLPLQQPLAPLPPLPPLPPLQQEMAAPLGLQGSPLAPQPALQPIGLPPGMGLQPQQPVVQVQVQPQQHVVVQAVQPQPDLGLGQGLGMGMGGGPRPLLQQDSFTSEHQRALFKQMSLGIQRDTADVEAGYYIGSPPEGQAHHLVDALAAHDAAQPSASQPAGEGLVQLPPVGKPAADLAGLLASPPHGGPGHKRSLSRHGSGLSRLISKNWEMDVLEMLPDVDADISTFPVGDGLVIEVAERPASPASRMLDQAGIAFFGSAAATGATATTQHALEPSPLAAAGLVPDGRGIGPSPAGAAALSFATPPKGELLNDGTPTAAAAAAGSSPLAGSPLAGGLQFAAGDAAAVAQRTTAVKDRSSRRDLQAAAFGSVPRTGSHTHLAGLARRSVGPGDVAAEEAEAARRKERAEAAATAAQEHRDEKLAAARNKRLASSEEAEEALELIDVPDNILRLPSFLRTTTGDREGLAALAAQAGGPSALMRSITAEMQDLVAMRAPTRTTTVDMLSAEELQEEAARLLKHMSIDEVDAVAAVTAYAKELEVMPTIQGSSELEADTVPSGARASLSDDVASSRDHSITSILEGQGRAAGAATSAPQRSQ